jgi:hypothetical protein
MLGGAHTARFRNVEEIRQYYQNALSGKNSKAIQDILPNATGDVQIITDAILIKEAESLRECIQARLDEYYGSYTPKFYVRSRDRGERGLDDALRAQTVVRNDNGRRSIGLYFDENASWGTSVFDGSKDFFKPWGIDAGWRVGSDKWFSNINHFGYYEGADFIQNGIDDWLQKTKYKNIDVVRTNYGGRMLT